MNVRKIKKLVVFVVKLKSKGDKNSEYKLQSNNYDNQINDKSPIHFENHSDITE